MSEDMFPKHWAVTRLKFVSSLKGRLGWQGLTAEEYRDEGPYVVSSAHFRDERIAWEMCPRVCVDRYLLDANIHLQPGDLLLMKDGAALGKLAFVEALPGPACLNSHLLLLRPKRNSYCPKYLYYYCATTYFQDYILIRGTGATFLGVSQETIGNHPLRLPPLEIQQRIADFLDAKTASIDTLIAKQEQLLTLLSEKRQGLITHAVTKGLDLNAPMKDSGNARFGSVPKHWEVSRIGYVALVGNGSTPSREEIRFWSDEEDGYPWLNSARINDERIVQAERWVTADALRECHLPKVPSDSVVVAITGEGQTRGRAALLEIEATISQHLAYIRPRRGMNATFLWRQLQAAYQWLRDESAGGGSTRAALTCEFLRTVSIVVPPSAEQELIVSHIEAELRRLDGLAQRAEAMVEKLREYRQALITAAVTGQLDAASRGPTARTLSHYAEADVA